MGTSAWPNLVYHVRVHNHQTNRLFGVGVNIVLMAVADTLYPKHTVTLVLLSTHHHLHHLPLKESTAGQNPDFKMQRNC